MFKNIRANLQAKPLFSLLLAGATIGSIMGLGDALAGELHVLSFIPSPFDIIVWFGMIVGNAYSLIAVLDRGYRH